MSNIERYWCIVHKGCLLQIDTKILEESFKAWPDEQFKHLMLLQSVHGTPNCMEHKLHVVGVNKPYPALQVKH